MRYKERMEKQIYKQRQKTVPAKFCVNSGIDSMN